VDYVCVDSRMRRRCGRQEEQKGKAVDVSGMTLSDDFVKLHTCYRTWQE
jgi:hypothetical protein